MRRNNIRGFTIIELLVVIVVIGILAAISFVSYSGVNKRAIIATLQSDLANGNKQLAMFAVENSDLPNTINCNIPVSDTNACFRPSEGNKYVYDSTTKKLGVRSIKTETKVNDSGEVTPLSCITGFILVPGNAELGTDDFCVMKYEAKKSNTLPRSTSTGTPWVEISQADAIILSEKSFNCVGKCHLITEGEWMTIAYNVIQDTGVSNWKNDKLYMGHSDNSPASALAASDDDLLGYTGTGNSTGPQKRTFVLSNGEVIWDFAGNVAEYTQGTVNSQPYNSANPTHAYSEWASVNNRGDLSEISFPFKTPSSSVLSWGSGKGMGALYSSPNVTGERAIIRGGHYSSNQYCASYGNCYGGVFSMDTTTNTTSIQPKVGFRATYTP